MSGSYTIIQDSREKNGWTFASYEKCKELKTRTLCTGDYTARGLEKYLAIERKASTGELNLNLGKKRKAFEAEMKRLSKFRFKYIICEFSIEDLMKFPENSGIPKKQWQFTRMNGKFMLKKLYEYQDRYDIPTIFCGDRLAAEERAIRIFDEVSEMLLRGSN